MASLMENLIEVLQQQSVVYAGLLELSHQKTPYIVAGDLENINRITDEEQVWLSKLAPLEKKRVGVTKDIANVLNKDVATLKISNLVEMLSSRPQEAAALASARDSLAEAVKSLQLVNERNRELIDHSLKLVEFDMTLLQSMKAAPTTANYDRGAYSTGSVMGVGMSSFDAKQ